MDAPFLDSVEFTKPELPPPPTEATPETDGDDSAFDPDDFPAWYREKVVAGEAPGEDAEGQGSAEHETAGHEAAGQEAEPEEAQQQASASTETEPGSAYPFDLAVVRTIDQLKFEPVTVLAGDNGSGKSTLIEAIAVAAGFNPEGGSRNLMFATHDTHSALADHLTLRWNSRPKWGWFLRAETFYGMATHITEDNDPESGVAVMFPDLHNRSHGESFLALAQSRFTGKGLYIFDEPEAALSIQGQMQLAAIMAASVAEGAQFIISTHSPFLMGYPDAAIYQASADDGLERCAFDDLTSTALWRRFFTESASIYKDLT